MYIVCLNSEKHFYFISTEDQRYQLEAKGVLIINKSYDKLTTAAAAIKELNNQEARLLSQRFLKTCRV